MRQLYLSLCMRIGIWAIGQKYGTVRNEEDARFTTMHELHHINAELTRQRDTWKLRESINRMKAQ